MVDYMIFLIVIVILCFALIPLAKKEAAKKGKTFSLPIHLLKFFILAVIVVIASFFVDKIFHKNSTPPPTIHIPQRIQNNTQ